MKKHSKSIYQFGRILGLAVGYFAAQQLWAQHRLKTIDIPRTLRAPLDPPPPLETFSETTETETYTRRHTLDTDGIERIVYIPKERRFKTPIVMQHGMWHGAWTWEFWQERLAAWGWETHAHSLPGHGRSPVRRPIAHCTLDYYLAFLKAEIARQPVRPILMGHSMGGALAQWYLKYVGDDLPAAVLVAPWFSDSMYDLESAWRLIRFDPVGSAMMLFTWDATPLARPAAASAARFLVGPRAIVPLEELVKRLGPESVMVLMQHTPPHWIPPAQVSTPMFWIAGETDPLMIEPRQRRSAEHYHADYYVAPQACHNVMMEHNYVETAEAIHHWLAARNIA